MDVDCIASVDDAAGLCVGLHQCCALGPVPVLSRISPFWRRLILGLSTVRFSVFTHSKISRRLTVTAVARFEAQNLATAV